MHFKLISYSHIDNSDMNPFKFLKERARLRKELINNVRELEWAHIFHDSIRGKEYLEKLPLNIGRWAGNYSFFYILNRILADYKPKRILDLGLGESSKFISTYISNSLLNTKHIIVEQDSEWIASFQNRFTLPSNSMIVHCPLIQKKINGHNSNSYDGFENKIKDKFDLYIVDGPFGSDRFSRHDIINLVENFSSKDEFIIIMDDTNRQGERDTLEEIKNLLSKKGIKFFVGVYSGNKQNTIIATSVYRNSTTF